jgi:hypothetical protein
MDVCVCTNITYTGMTITTKQDAVTTAVVRNIPRTLGNE